MGLLATKPYGAKELRCTEDRQLYLPCWARRSSRWVQPFRTLIHATILGSATPRRSTTRPPQLRLRCAHRDRGSPACRTSNPGIPVMHTTDTCGLNTRAVTQGGKEEYRPLLVTQQPRKYQRKRRDWGARTPLSRPSTDSSVGRAFVHQTKGSQVQILSGARYPRSSMAERPVLNSEGREINTRRGCKANVSLNHTGYSSEVELPAGCWWSQVRVLLARQLTSTLVVFVAVPPTLLSARRKQGTGSQAGVAHGRATWVKARGGTWVQIPPPAPPHLQSAR